MPTVTGQRVRRGRWATIVVAAAVAGAALLGWLAFGSVTSPAPSLTTLFLHGDGARLLVMHDLAADLATTPADPDRCRARAQELQAHLRADEAFALVTQVPDKPLSEAFAVQRPALGRFLSGCGQDVPTDPAQLRHAVALVSERLDALGLDR